METPNSHLAPRTQHAYATDDRDFQAWLTVNARPSPCTLDDVCDYLRSLADRGLRPSSIARKLTSISVTSERRGGPNFHKDRKVKDCLGGIRRQLGDGQTQKRPLMSSDLRAYFAMLGEGLRDLRDKAMLAVGLSGAFRRSELAAVTVEDITESPEGFMVSVPGENTRAIFKGEDPQICPVLLLRAWLQASGIESGPVFRPVGDAGLVGDHAICGRTVALAVKRAAAAIGKDPTAFSGGSLRSGFCTETTLADMPERDIGHQIGLSLPALRRQIRLASVFLNNAARAIGKIQAFVED